MLKLNAFNISNTSLLKIYFDLSQPNLDLTSGIFTYVDDSGQSLDLPIIYPPDGIMLINLSENRPYAGTLKLSFATGETPQQDLGSILPP